MGAGSFIAIGELGHPPHSSIRAYPYMGGPPPTHALSGWSEWATRPPPIEITNDPLRLSFQLLILRAFQFQYRADNEI